MTESNIPLSSNQKSLSLDDITIRGQLQSGDIGYLIWLHGTLYKEEYDYGLGFEAYVAESIAEFYHNYDSDKDRVWICEHQEKIIGSLFLVNRRKEAQLRYFLIRPGYRGLGLGKELMERYMNSLRKLGYPSSYLWTTHELGAAASLYKRHGFTLVEEKPSTLFDKPINEQKYEVILI